jgi:hypothetical protein
MATSSQLDAREQALNDYERQLKQQEDAISNANNSSAYSPTMFANPQSKMNLVEYELDFKPELESIERLLRCDVIMRDKDGNEFWIPNPDPSKRFFNEQGVNDFLRSLVVIVNKNKVLSTYSPDEVNDRVKQIKHEVRILIYNNYEEYGMDNDYKMNNYSMIVLAIGSIIEDTYRRALYGETHKGLAEQRLVTQNDSVQQQTVMPMQQPSKRKIWNPFTWMS